MAELADLRIGPKPIERLVKRIGRERIDQRDAAVAEHQQRPLMEKDAIADPRRPCPAVAMVSMDGDRLQVQSTTQSPSQPKPTSHWRESKTAVLETYQSEVHQADPDPDVPRCFLDLKRTAELVRGQGHALPVGLELGGQAASPAVEEPTPAEPDRATRPGRPQGLVRSVLASRATSDDFGPMIHQSAWERNFFGATRRAFLGDGLAANWTVHRRPR